MAPWARFELSRLTADPFPMIGAWLISGLFAIVIPIIKWNKNKQKYYNYYGKYVEYENQQRQYEQNNNGYNGGNGNNNGYGYQTCKWYQWGCRKRQAYYRQQNGEGENNIYTPTWYTFIGGKTGGDEDRRWREEMGLPAEETSGALKFVYAWTMVLFVGLLAFGAWSLYKKRSMSGIVVACMVFAQFALLNLVTIGQGVISSDQRDLEDSVYGWYGQMGVLMVYTDFWYMLYCFLFSIVFGIRAWLGARRRRASKGDGEEEEANNQGGYYENYEDPEVRVTNVY